MGALNSSSCSGTLSFRLISGGSLLPKQHRRPRPGRVLFLGGMAAAVTQVAVVVLDQEMGGGGGPGRGGGGAERMLRSLSWGHDLKKREKRHRYRHDPNVEPNSNQDRRFYFHTLCVVNGSSERMSPCEGTHVSSSCKLFGKSTGTRRSCSGCRSGV